MVCSLGISVFADGEALATDDSQTPAATETSVENTDLQPDASGETTGGDVTEVPDTTEPQENVPEETSVINNHIIQAGDELTYVIEFENPADIEKTATVEDTVPDGMEFISADKDGSLENGKITWTVPLAANEKSSVSFKVRVLDPAKGTIQRNTATVKFDRVSKDTNEVKNPVQKDPVKEVKDQNGENIDTMTVAAGSDLFYTITVENPADDAREYVIKDTYPTTATIKSIEDGGVDNAGTITWTVTIDPQSSKTVSFVMTADKKGVAIDNEASISIDDVNLSTNITKNGVPNDPVKGVLFEEKDADGSMQQVGNTLTYTITVQNPMTIAKTARLIDKLPAGVEFVSADNDAKFEDGEVKWALAFEPGEEKTVTVTVKVKEEAKNTVLQNKAILTFDNPVETNIVNNPVIGDPVKEVLNAAGENINGHPVSLTDELTYKISFKNPAEEEKTFVITDTVPKNTTVVKINDNGVDSNGTISWTVQVPAGETKSVSFVVKAAKEGVQFNNKAYIAVDNAKVATNEVSNAVPVDPKKSVESTKGNDLHTKTIFAGSEMIYKITISNPFDAEKEYKVEDVLPNGAKFVSASDEGKASGQTVTWNLKLKANEAKTISVTAKVEDSAKESALKNKATQTFVPGKDDGSKATPWHKDTNEVVTYVAKDPVKAVTNASGADYNGGLVFAGEELIYKITVSNPAGAEPAKFTITDSFPTDKLDFVSASDGGANNSGTVTFNVTVNGGQSKEVSFRVRVKQQKETIKNTANVAVGPNAESSKRTNEVVNYLAVGPEKQVFYNGEMAYASEIPAGHLLEYRIILENPSDKDRTMTVTDNLDANLIFQQATDGGSASGQTVTWNNVNVPANSKKTLTVVVKIKEETAAGTRINNTAKLIQNGHEMESNQVHNFVKAPPVNPIVQTVQTVQNRVVTAAKTGDSSNLPLFIGILAAALVIGGGVFLYTRKKR